MEYKLVFLAFILAAFISTGSCVKCYECNVWKAGYGDLCAKPRIRSDCRFCMKLDTRIWTGYYKDTPRYANTTTRICANDIMPHFSNECHRYTTVDGSSTRCYCDTDLCNSGRTVTPSHGGRFIFPLIAVAAASWVITGQQH